MHVWMNVILQLYHQPNHVTRLTRVHVKSMAQVAKSISLHEQNSPSAPHKTISGDGKVYYYNPCSCTLKEEIVSEYCHVEKIFTMIIPVSPHRLVLDKHLNSNYMQVWCVDTTVSLTMLYTLAVVLNSLYIYP